MDDKIFSEIPMRTWRWLGVNEARGHRQPRQIQHLLPLQRRKDLKNINNLTSNTLLVGQRLLVPKSLGIVDSLVTNYVDYRIVPGDTLYSIGSKYNVSVDDLKSINNLTNGQEGSIECSQCNSIGQYIIFTTID